MLKLKLSDIIIIINLILFDILELVVFDRFKSLIDLIVILGRLCCW